MKISKHSGIFTLEAEQYLETSMEKAWDFFSDPSNLSIITPPYMKFEITSCKEDKMYEGQIITYRIGILPFIKTYWITEITHVKDGFYFVDEQRLGPYKLWHHEHFFYEADKGILMKDKVSFSLPFRAVSNFTIAFYIKKQLRKIFNYRSQRLDEIFNQ